MKRITAQTWFGSLSPGNKVLALLDIMYELTITLRGIFLHYPNDSETRARLAYRISEINHRLTASARAIMNNQETYPDHVLIDMLFEEDDRSQLGLSDAFDRAMKWQEKRARK